MKTKKLDDTENAFDKQKILLAILSNRDNFKKLILSLKKTDYVLNLFQTV